MGLVLNDEKKGLGMGKLGKCIFCGETEKNSHNRCVYNSDRAYIVTPSGKIVDCPKYRG